LPERASGRVNTSDRAPIRPQTTVRAVAADPEAFTEEHAWWSLTFEELEFTIAGIPVGDKAFHQLVRQDESGEWVLDHPGYED
jgi:hypothetical protein